MNQEKKLLQVNILCVLIIGNFEDFKCRWYKTLQPFSQTLIWQFYLEGSYLCGK